MYAIDASNLTETIHQLGQTTASCPPGFASSSRQCAQSLMNAQRQHTNRSPIEAFVANPAGYVEHCVTLLGCSTNCLVKLHDLLSQEQRASRQGRVINHDQEAEFKIHKAMCLANALGVSHLASKPILRLARDMLSRGEHLPVRTEAWSGYIFKDEHDNLNYIGDIKQQNPIKLEV